MPGMSSGHGVTAPETASSRHCSKSISGTWASRTVPLAMIWTRPGTSLGGGIGRSVCIFHEFAV